jgi:hypothetical protein
VPAAVTRILVCLLAVGLPAQLVAQGAEPLRKTDLIRLLSSPLIRKGEVADLVRRNCLTFRPTERDWADLRDLGADPDVLSSVGGCGARSTVPARPTIQPISTARVSTPASAPEPALPALTAAPFQSRVGATVGTDAFVRVTARRGEVLQAGVALMLRGSSSMRGGAGRDVQAVTDDSGLAVFPVPAGRQPGTYRLELVSGAGASLPGRPMLDVVVRPGRPVAAEVRPSLLELGSAQEGPFAVQVAVRDTFGNPVPNEPIELRPETADMGIAPDTRMTDSLGKVAFVVSGPAVQRPGKIAVRARGERLASLEAVLGGPVTTAGTGFVSSGARRGVARTTLQEPFVFQARSAAGRPLPGRIVRFRARNAQVSPDSAVTDADGQARVEVKLGTQAGSAVLIASVDSVQRSETISVDPGPAVEIILERDGTRVDGGRIIVEVGAPFALTVKARDGYGNAVPTAALARALQEMVTRFNARRQLLRALGVQSDSQVTSIRFKPTAVGSTDLTFALGLTASVSVEVVSPRR